MTRTRVVLALAGALATGAFAASTAPSAAMPKLDPGVATANDLAQTKPESVRYVCNRWGRCWWQPGYRRTWAPRPIYRPYGWGGGPRWGYGGWRHRHW